MWRKERPEHRKKKEVQRESQRVLSGESVVERRRKERGRKKKGSYNSREVFITQ